MKILHLSTYDIAGGAARAAYRLHQGLQKEGAESFMYVHFKTSTDNTVFTPPLRIVGELRKGVSQLPLFFYPQKANSLYSVQLPFNNMKKIINTINPDVINLHWINDGYLDIKGMRAWNKPVIWTLHDMWAFTGGCHYNQDCQKYMQSCGACHLLGSSNKKDLSYWQIKHKTKVWPDINLTVVTPSQWLGNCAKQSPLLADKHVEIIPNGLDIKQYIPFEKKKAREILDLPQNKQLILFGALSATQDIRKGFDLFKEALENLRKSFLPENLEIVVLGGDKLNKELGDYFKTHHLGTLRDDISLRMAYSAADIFIAPSRQDNLPNTVLESLSCGVPVVAFNIGGMSDLIDHKKTGYLAKPFNTKELAYGVEWCLEKQERYNKIVKKARFKVENHFSQNLQARRYLNLYESIIKKT